MSNLDDDFFRQAMLAGGFQGYGAQDEDPFLRAMRGQGAPQALVPPLPAPGPPAPAIAPPPAVALPPPPATPEPKPRGKESTDQMAARGAAEQEAAIRKQAEAEAESEMAKALGAEKAAQELKARQDADFQFRADVDTSTQAKRAALEKDIADLGKTKIDNGRLFRNSSTGEKIFTGVMLFLGGATGNKAPIEGLMRAIDTDIKSQIVDLDTKRGALGAKQTQLQLDRSAGMEMADARAKATVLAYDATIKEIQAQAAKIQAPAVRERANEAIAKLTEARANTMEQWTQERKRTAIAGGHLALAQKQFDESKRQFETQATIQINAALQAGNVAQAKKLQDDKEKTIFAVSDEKNGQVLAPSGEIAKDLNKKIGSAVSTVSGIDRLKEIREKIRGGGIGILKEDERKEAESIAIQLAYDLSILQEQGVIRESEMPNYEKMLGDPTAWRDTLPQLAAVRNRIVGRVNADIEARTGTKLKEKWDVQFRPPGATPDELIDPRAPSGRTAPAGLTPLAPVGLTSNPLPPWAR